MVEGLSRKTVDSLLDKLENEGLYVRTLLNFELLYNDNGQKVHFAENLLKEHKLLPDYDQFKLTKCKKKAEEFKNSGNQLYKDKKFYEALVSYNKSLCYSPKDSQDVGIAFANRSAVYFEMGQYEKCLENIELAKSHNYPRDKIVKLNNRKEQAVENFNNFPDPNQKMMKYEAARERFLKPKLKAKENLNFFVADCLEVKTSPEFGRHLITNQDLKVGSVIAVEKPFSTILDLKVIHERCTNCLRKNLLNLLPCFNCCSAMFCSEDCRSAAQEKFHKYECGLINVIDVLFTKSFGLPLRTYFEALHVCGSASGLREFLKSIKGSTSRILDFDNTDKTTFRRNSLHSIDTSVTADLEVQDCFIRSIICAILSDLMLNHSALRFVLVSTANQDFFREFIFKYSLISSINFHSLTCTTSKRPYQVQFGSASFPFCSLINHSCAPNTIRESFETTNILLVIRPIKKGQQIFESYRYHFRLESYEERQKGLYQQYKFKCNCEACKNDYPLLKKKFENEYLLEMFMKDLPFLTRIRDLNFAVANYDKYCKLIDKLDEKYYPSYDVNVLQEMMMLCFGIFTKSESYKLN